MLHKYVMLQRIKVCKPMSLIAVVIVEEEGKYLLVEERSGFWALPGGKVKVGENLVEAARREVREETGYDVEVQGIVRIYQQVDHPAAPVVFAFRGKVKGRSGEGSLRTKWLTERDIDERAGYLETLQLVRISKKWRKIREHDNLRIYL
ncbi:MAG: NUDIX domain-containing protein [Candidatus Freyarchaeota archaeon]|nr:NUDIX domain-containing protein [Candidatus Jordarchaeia archaeon]